MIDPYPRAYRRTLHRDMLRTAAVALDGLACFFALVALTGLWRLWQGGDPAGVGQRISGVLAAVILVIWLIRAAEWFRRAELADRAGDADG